MDIPPPPWTSEIEGVVWWHRAAAPPPTGLPDEPWLPLTLGGFVAYHDGPVGPYDEVFAAPYVLRGGASHVVFLAVDSERSVAGGRGNWALPKELASFAALGGQISAEGEGWRVTAGVRARPRDFPLRVRGPVAQVHPDGIARRFSARVRGRVRLASVDVRAQGVPWLANGRHRALVVRGRQDIGPPQDLRRRMGS